MSSVVDYEINAEPRSDTGKGASRRLRRAGKVPGIMYGASKEPTQVAFTHLELLNKLGNEKFFSKVLKIKLGSGEESAVIKDLQRHPYKPVILHMDLQRVSATEKLRMHIPLHFVNAAIAPGVKEGGLVSHNIVEIEVQCLPKDLPEFIEVDLSHLGLNAVLHLSDLKTPGGVEVVELLHGKKHNQAVVSIHMPRAEEEEKPAAVVAEGEAAAAAGAAAPAAGAAASAAEADKKPEKK
ncbi:MAG: 50S ribosomal protein L25/general stress protein Ctc [Gammaproteobacteria bacterium]|nr:50S ribosomal protein L25/general stress protein Ctc [Gammaproteobacteria bacterium]